MSRHVSGRPRIGITLEFEDPQIAQVEQRVRGAIEGAGGLAVIVPPSEDPTSWQAVYERLDGVVLMGGGDVDPSHYGAERHSLTVPAPAGADVTDLGLARAALADGTPILGVCRGSQVLAVAGGGSLIQDVPSLVGRDVAHSGDWRTASQALASTATRCASSPARASPRCSAAPTRSTPTTTRRSTGWAPRCGPSPTRRMA